LPSRVHKAKKVKLKGFENDWKKLCDSLLPSSKIPKHKQWEKKKVNVSGLIKITLVRNAGLANKLGNHFDEAE
jgi:hypothetical protein